MKVLMVSAYFDTHRGGVEIVCGNLCRTLTKLGDSVTWLASREDVVPLSRPGLTCVTLSACNILERKFGIPWPVWGSGSLRRLGSEIAAADVVVIHDALYLGSIAASLIARRLGKAVVLVQHIGLIPYRNFWARAAMCLGDGTIARHVARTADQVVFISETTRAHYSGLRYRHPPSILFNGVDTGVFHPLPNPGDRDSLRQRLGLRAGRSNLAFVGRFVEKKGLPVIRRLVQIMPEINWLLAGWGPEDPRCWGLDNVHVFSDRSGGGIAEIYQAADLLALPSVGEGFPLVIQESLACGTPVICGTDTATADSAIHGHLFCAKVDMADIDGTAATWKLAIQSALRDVFDGKVDSQVLAGIARQRYDWDAVAQAYRRIFIDAIARRERCD